MTTPQAPSKAPPHPGPRPPAHIRLDEHDAAKLFPRLTPDAMSAARRSWGERPNLARILGAWPTTHSPRLASCGTYTKRCEVLQESDAEKHIPIRDTTPRFLVACPEYGDRRGGLRSVPFIVSESFQVLLHVQTGKGVIYDRTAHKRKVHCYLDTPMLQGTKYRETFSAPSSVADFGHPHQIRFSPKSLPFRLAQKKLPFHEK